MVVVPADGDILALERRIGAAEDRHHVPRRILAGSVDERRVAGDGRPGAPVWREASGPPIIASAIARETYM